MLQSRKMSIFHLPFPEIFLFIFSNENMKLFMGKAFVNFFLISSQKMVKMVKKKMAPCTPGNSPCIHWADSVAF